MIADAAPGSVRAWAPDVEGISEVFHASFVDYAYPKHCHDTWTVMIIDAGLVRYDLHHHDRGADITSVTVLPPFVAHDGRSGRVGHGFRKRVLYLDTGLFDERLVGAAVDCSTLTDQRLRRDLDRLHGALDDADGPPTDDLECDSRLALVVDRIQSGLTSGTGTAGGRRRARPEPLTASASARTAHDLRDHLDADLFARHHLGAVADDLGWNATHLIRSFTATFGLAPHQYLIARRVAEARRRLLGGQPAADVAVAVGFHDQAHLTRHFTRHVSTSPARFQRSRRAPLVR
ncbi:MAG: transcriptional regulator, AraC family [Ilumatobacteraceae bacterium]|nr:transcriptional regulator, AraC family [Ilumatobacteraceae bacterium]